MDDLTSLSEQVKALTEQVTMLNAFYKAFTELSPEPASKSPKTVLDTSTPDAQKLIDEHQFAGEKGRVQEWMEASGFIPAG